MANSQVVKSRSSSECEAGEVVFAETTLIPDFPHYLGGPDVVLDLYADAGDLPVEFHQHLIKDESLRPFERHEDRRIFPVFHVVDILKRYNIRQLMPMAFWRILRLLLKISKYMAMIKAKAR